MSGPAVSLHPVGPEAGAELAELRARAMKPSLEAVGRFDEQRVRMRFLEGFDPAWTRAIVRQQQRVGFVVVRPVDDHLLLDHLYIDPAAQGSGVGSAVLGLVIDEARRAGKTLRVGALRQSRSNAFYRRHGFVLEAEGDWDNYYARAPGDA